MSTRRLGTTSSLPSQLSHGTLPWNGDHQRRALLYKFSPGFQAYSAGAHEIAYPAYIEDMKEEERAVMEAPFVRRN